MTQRGPAERSAGLSRPGLVRAALALVELEGLGGLSMRALADRLGVKAASLYWHVRDRDELLALLAVALLEQVPLPSDDGPWRPATEGLCEAVHQLMATHRDSARILLEAPSAVGQSRVSACLRGLLHAAGLSPEEAAAASAMLLDHIVLEQLRALVPVPAGMLGESASLTIENPSRDVTLRAGVGMDGLARASRGAGAGATVRVFGSEVEVRRVRGTRQAIVQLNPLVSWTVHVKGGTWNTRLVLSGVRLVALKLDGGATGINCTLPVPRGSVPIKISGGVVGVRLHRPAGSAAVVAVSAGALQVRLDGSAMRATLTERSWVSAGGGADAADRYELQISGGAVRVSLDARGPAGHAVGPVDGLMASPTPEPDVAIRMLLDAIEHRARG